MSDDDCLERVIEHLLLYNKFQTILAYFSTCKQLSKERRFLLQQHAVVNYRVVDRFTHQIKFKYQLAIVFCVQQLPTLPCTVTHLRFVESFDHKLHSVAFPPNLTHLMFGFQFNQPLDSALLPPKLTHLTFGDCFNQPLENVKLPSKLTHLTLGACFDQPLQEEALPPSLTHLSFGLPFKHWTRSRCRRS